VKHIEILFSHGCVFWCADVKCEGNLLTSPFLVVEL